MARKIAICVPVRDQMHSACAFDLLRLQAYHARFKNDELRVFFQPGTIIFDQRIDLAKQALEWGADWILWIDSDMRFPANTLEGLLSRCRDIVGANYPTRQLPPDPTAFRFDGEKWERVHSRGKNGLEEVTGLGMGCMLTSTRVFKKLPKPWFMFGYSHATERPAGEDIYFSMLAEKEGFKTFLDHDLSHRVKHLGMIEFEMAHVEPEAV